MVHGLGPMKRTKPSLMSLGAPVLFVLSVKMTVLLFGFRHRLCNDRSAFTATFTSSFSLCSQVCPDPRVSFRQTGLLLRWEGRQEPPLLMNCVGLNSVSFLNLYFSAALNINLKILTSCDRVFNALLFVNIIRDHMVSGCAINKYNRYSIMIFLFKAPLSELSAGWLDI